MKKIAIIIGSIAVPGCAALVLLTGSPDPPTGSFESARESMDRAGKAGAALYARERYRAGETLFREGWLEMARQKGRLPRLRDYSRADSLLVQAGLAADQATNSTLIGIKRRREEAQAERARFGEDLLQWRDALEGTLIRHKVEKYLEHAEMAYTTSGRLASSGEFDSALKEIRRGAESLAQLAKHVGQYSEDEAGTLHVWRAWVRETIEASRKSGRYAVIVDKSKHKLYLVRGGRLLETFGCELGRNPSVQKSFSGDGATPEGKYRVTGVNGGSEYYKALLLDYPNAEDRRRFKDNISKGVVSKSARIGGLIEIHGHGGRGLDWTNGCVALTDGDMDRLLRFAKAGTAVTIVRKSDVWP